MHSRKHKGKSGKSCKRLEEKVGLRQKESVREGGILYVLWETVPEVWAERTEAPDPMAVRQAG